MKKKHKEGMKLINEIVDKVAEYCDNSPIMMIGFLEVLKNDIVQLAGNIGGINKCLKKDGNDNTS